MSEYTEVEKPLLERLSSLGWEVIDHGPDLPSAPDKSLRDNFRDVFLKEVFFTSVKEINLTDTGEFWLSDSQLDELFNSLLSFPEPGLTAKNEAALKWIRKAQVDLNQLTGEENPVVKIIDFDTPEKNRFIAINQFRIDTPGQVKEFIIPDIVLFINGIPVGVIECKSPHVLASDPMDEAIQQLLRYMDRREESIKAGLREGKQDLFVHNHLVVATCGSQSLVGSISSEEEHFFPWKYVSEERERSIANRKDHWRYPQDLLVTGILSPVTLIDIISSYLIYLKSGTKSIKIFPRHQQYRAVQKGLKRLKTEKTPEERSGTVWHTQGSGKSFTMVYMIRAMRKDPDLQSWKVILINDRKDLEAQLAITAHYSGEKPNVIENAEQAKQSLATESSNLSLVMAHKFFPEKEGSLPEYVADARIQYGTERPEKYELFPVLNESDRVLIMVDEAHRTMYEDLGNNIFNAFPNATFIAFTGTPLITSRHRQTTQARFGKYIDTYKIKESVEDGSTVKIIYEGRTADTAIEDRSRFDRRFEDLFKDRSETEIEAIKRKYGTTDDLLEAESRIQKIAQDIVEHYLQGAFQNGFKAQVVANSKLAAVRYQKKIEEELDRLRLDVDFVSDMTADDREVFNILQTGLVLSSSQTNELAEVVFAMKKAGKKDDIIENFKKSFHSEKPETGVGFLIVCDMLLTGFDAPIEQVMYVDKKIKEHNLLQAIARVNRVAPEKKAGYIVDYVGLANHLKEALEIYSGDDANEILREITDIQKELPILETRYQRIIHFFREENSIDLIEDYLNQKLSAENEISIFNRIIEVMEDIGTRTRFLEHYNYFLMSMDIVLPRAQAQGYLIPMKRLGFLLMKIRETYRDESLNIRGAGRKIRMLINEHLRGLGVDSKINPTDILSADFQKQLDKNKSAKNKASEMEHAIRSHLRFASGKDPVRYKHFSEKLDTILKKYKDDWDAMAKALEELMQDIREGRKNGESGLPAQVQPFYDLIVDLCYGNAGQSPEVELILKRVVVAIYRLIQERVQMHQFWTHANQVERLKGEIGGILAGKDIPDEIWEKSDLLKNELVDLAKKRHEEITGNP